MVQRVHMSSEFLTKEKKVELEEELLHLKTVIRPAIAERVQTARALGDLSENADYQTSRSDQGKNEGRIQQIEAILKNSKIIERSGSSKVEFGATVIVKKTSDGVERTFMIVDDAEADIGQGKITPKSPIGEAMCDKSVGDRFVITTPRGEVEYEIVSVS
ncbi:MAG: transcription elongation factor GreA [Patescibacteria group bacterium]|nr:transcription elongation factor GreA [Patescibacteria group bacterium]